MIVLLHGLSLKLIKSILLLNWEQLYTIANKQFSFFDEYNSTFNDKLPFYQIFCQIHITLLHNCVYDFPVKLFNSD